MNVWLCWIVCKDFAPPASLKPVKEVRMWITPISTSCYVIRCWTFCLRWEVRANHFFVIHLIFDCLQNFAPRDIWDEQNNLCNILCFEFCVSHLSGTFNRTSIVQYNIKVGFNSCGFGSVLFFTITNLSPTCSRFLSCFTPSSTQLKKEEIKWKVDRKTISWTPVPKTIFWKQEGHWQWHCAISPIVPIHHGPEPSSLIGRTRAKPLVEVFILFVFHRLTAL